MPLSPGKQFGSYEILSLLGSGGMGDVYLGRDSRLGREVAIKLLPGEFSANHDRLRRFEQEARSASALNHPNIITIYEIGSIDSHSFIAMEYLDGKTLRDSLQSGPMPLRQAFHIAAQLAEGLAKAHEAGIVHRDLKPENIMITRDGYAKILDFGLAKLSSPAGAAQLSALPTAVKTDAGIVLGTVGYMSPEQASAGVTDFRSDQFSLGTILYEMVTGKRAFQKNTSVETLSAIINEEPEPVQSINPRVAAPLRWIIERCLEKNPHDRYASTRDLAHDLAGIRDHFSEITSSSSIAARPEVGSLIRSLRLRDLIGISLIALLSSALVFAVRHASSGVPTPIKYHRLTYRRGPIDSARFTRDGHTIVYDARWEGSQRELFVTRPDAIESHPLGVSGAQVLSISPSGAMLLLEMQEDDRNILAEASVTGGTPRELSTDVRAADWSPDGSGMALARSIKGRTRVEYPPGKILYDSPLDIHDLRFSPTGDRLAFVEHQYRSANGKVVIIDMNGRKVAESRDCWPLGLAWRSTDEVWFTTMPEAQGGGIELHALGKSGTLRYIAPFVWASLADISTDGDVLIRFDERNTVAQGSPSGDPKETHLTWLDESEVVDISRDATRVLVHERGEASDSPNGTIYTENIDGSGGVRLAGGQPVEFSPDGKSVLANQGKERPLTIVPVGAGSAQSFEIPAGEMFGPIGFLPDGKRFLLWSSDPGAGTTVWIQRLAGGKPVSITTQPNIKPMRSRKISSDGRLVIATAMDNRDYVLLSLEDGKVQPLRGLEKGEEPIQWARDGQTVFVYNPNHIPCSIVKVNIFDGKRVLFKEISPSDLTGVEQLASLRIADDEKTYAYSYRRTLSSLYVVSGLR